MKNRCASFHDKPAAGNTLPVSSIASFLTLDAAMAKASINLIDVLTGMPSAQRSQIPVDEMRHFPEDDVFDPVTGCQYFLHRHAGAEAQPSIHIHFFQRWTPPELRLQESETITTHLAALELDTLGKPQAWFVVNQWVVGDYWQPADETIQLFRDWQIVNPDAGRGQHIPASCHQWLAAYLKLSLMDAIYPLLCERDAFLDAWVDAHPGTNVLEERAHEVLGYQSIDFSAQLAGWKRAVESQDRASARRPENSA